MLRVAVQLRSLRQPFKQALLTARRLGVAGVEIDARGEFKPQELSGTGLRQVRKMLADLDLTVVAVGFATRRGYDQLEDLDRRVEATRQAMKFARGLGADLVVNQIGRLPDDPESASGRQFLDVLRELAAAGDHAGAWLAAETGAESGSGLAKLLKALPSGRLPVAFNPGNLILNGFSVAEAVEALGGDIRYVRATDAVRDLARGRGLNVSLGKGSADIPALAGALEQHGYRGWFTVACEESRDPLAEAAAAVEFLKGL